MGCNLSNGKGNAKARRKQPKIPNSCQNGNTDRPDYEGPASIKIQGTRLSKISEAASHSLQDMRVLFLDVVLLGPYAKVAAEQATSAMVEERRLLPQQLVTEVESLRTSAIDHLESYSEYSETSRGVRSLRVSELEFMDFIDNMPQETPRKFRMRGASTGGAYVAKSEKSTTGTGLQHRLFRSASRRASFEDPLLHKEEEEEEEEEADEEEEEQGAKPLAAQGFSMMSTVQCKCSFEVDGNIVSMHFWPVEHAKDSVPSFNISQLSSAGFIALVPSDLDGLSLELTTSALEQRFDEILYFNTGPQAAARQPEFASISKESLRMACTALRNTKQYQTQSQKELPDAIDAMDTIALFRNKIGLMNLSERGPIDLGDEAAVFGTLALGAARWLMDRIDD